MTAPKPAPTARGETGDSSDNVRFVKAANVVTMTSNGETMDAGTVQVTACWIELDSLGAAG